LWRLEKNCQRKVVAEEEEEGILSRLIRPPFPIGPFIDMFHSKNSLLYVEMERG